MRSSSEPSASTYSRPRTARGPYRVPPRGALDAAVHGLTLLVGARLEADLARYADDVELIVLPAANSAHVQPTDFAHTSRLIGEGLAAARAALHEQPVGGAWPRDA